MSRHQHTAGTAVAVPKRAHIKHHFLFLGKFFQNRKSISSVWPSSPHLAKATIHRVNFQTAKVLVELGAGTGPITEAVVKRLQPHTRFVAIERDHDFAKILQDRFSSHPNVHIVRADVRDLSQVLADLKIKKVDNFLSCLPTPNRLPPEICNRLLESIEEYLAPQGIYSNITEVPLLYKKYYHTLFKHVDFQFVPLNMPPGGVYHCRELKKQSHK